MVPMIDVLAQSDTSSGSPFTFLIFLLPIAALFFLMRSQRKKLSQQQALQQDVGVGDEVLFTSGIFGRVDAIDEDDTLWVEIAPGTRIHAVRAAIARRVVDDVDADDDETDTANIADIDDEGTTGAP
jgi:preprotein translocase subunit YajC